ncbi:hypothetical protein HGRIS_008258 [Hohenbuehelia grisea]|uniref:Uncharacterized protein n=1 Tax=Hohenbuehelia grisea TaxID=104357 RepID=A0ABR3J7T6_9AGAR
MLVVNRLAEFSTAHQGPYFDHLIPSCADIAHILSEKPATEEDLQYLCGDSVQVFIVQGLMPVDVGVIEEVHQLMWKELCRSQFRLGPHLAIPLIHNEVLVADFDSNAILRFQPRLKAAIGWLMYCSSQLDAGNGPEIDPQKYPQKKLERDAEIMSDILRFLQEIEARLPEGELDPLNNDRSHHGGVGDHHSQTQESLEGEGT